LIRERLHIKSFPNSVFKLTSTDEDSNNKLKELITGLAKKENLNLSKLSSEKLKNISIKLMKAN